MKSMRTLSAGLFCLGCGLLAFLLFAVLRPIRAQDAVNPDSTTIASDEVFIPAGQFMMGCSPDLYPDGCDGDTYPIHAVYLNGFYIDRTEVTNAQYNACMAAGACGERRFCESQTRPDYCENPKYANFPVIGVNWSRANEYCTWVGKRLPTEAEWEKAARGTDLRKYPWGDEAATCERANFLVEFWPDPVPCVGDTVAIGSYPDNVSPYGAWDMSGNVSEWVNDWYEPHYYYKSPYYNPPGPDITVKKEHLVRGGSWQDNARSVTTLVRLDESEIYKTKRIGFRCAKSLTGTAPVPTPVPTPTPYAVNAVGPEGGIVWLAYPGHLTLLRVPSGAVGSSTVFTLAFDSRPDTQDDLQGIGHFFSLDADPPLFEASSRTVVTPGSARFPLELTLGYTKPDGVIRDTVDLYRLDSTGWLTTHITVTAQTAEHIVAWTDQLGTFGVLGRTNRHYLPILMRATP
jgi:formylglycine-generating enzyme required for sulfatase activity